MNLFEIEIGRRYKCDLYGGQYFGTVKEKRDGRIGVALGNRVGTDDDPRDRPGIGNSFGLNRSIFTLCNVPGLSEAPASAVGSTGPTLHVS
jgi:hypothetical protein